jgi:hypothetical protein
MKKFLRYNSRHNLYYHPERGLKLNPISSVYDGKQKSWHEPLSVYRLRKRVFSYAGRQRCGRRDDPFAYNHNDGELPDTWDMGPDGNRTCSYCGSMHYDDFIDMCRLAIVDEGYSIDPSDKGYKVYVRQPGVRNASEGAIKYYKQHTPPDAAVHDQELFQEAAQVSHQRFNEQMEKRCAELRKKP